MLASCSLSVARHCYNCLRWNSELSVMNLINSNRCKWPNKNWGLVNSYVVSRLISRPSQMSGWVETTTADWITTAQFSLSDVDNSHARLVLAGVHEFPFGELQPGPPRAVFNVSPRRGIAASTASRLPHHQPLPWIQQLPHLI